MPFNLRPIVVLNHDFYKIIRITKIIFASFAEPFASFAVDILPQSSQQFNPANLVNFAKIVVQKKLTTNIKMIYISF